jgi:hypothetical protein
VNTLDTALSNLTTPMVLAFVLGAGATLLGSDLRFPRAIAKGLSIYLLFAIGLKGGVALHGTTFGEIWLPALVTLGLGLTIPVGAFLVAHRVAGFSRIDSAALAAHYGSVSAVTFAAALAFTREAGVEAEGFLPTLLAILEVPGIIVALLIAGRSVVGGRRGWGPVLRETLTGTSVVLLVGGLAIGAASGPGGYAQVEPFFGALFYGMLTLFLLELGTVAASRAREVRAVARRLVPYGLVLPVVNGTIGTLLGAAAGLSVGGATVLGAMAASASYIAAPAAVRIALPQANPGISLTAAVAITFPFNLVLGIPLFYVVASAVA